MKIKQAFEDFVVDEIFDVETKDEGKYAFVLLTKLIGQLSEQLCKLRGD